MDGRLISIVIEGTFSAELSLEAARACRANAESYS
jgi:hypothetical protein